MPISWDDSNGVVEFMDSSTISFITLSDQRLCCRSQSLYAAVMTEVELKWNLADCYYLMDPLKNPKSHCSHSLGRLCFFGFALW